MRKSPLLDLTSHATDLIQVAKSTFAVAFTCGTLWIKNVRDNSHPLVLLGLAYMTTFLGQELKASCINAVDQLLLPWKESLSMHPALFNDQLDNGPRVTEFITIGDAHGNLVLFKNRKPVFHD